MNKTMIVTNTVINYKLPPSVSTHGGAIWGGAEPANKFGRVGHNADECANNCPVYFIFSACKIFNGLRTKTSFDLSICTEILCNRRRKVCGYWYSRTATS